jgi:hypothetical protein
MEASLEVGGVAEPVAGLPRESATMRLVNLRLRELREDEGDCDAIPFFCECSDPACYAVIWRSATAFDASTADEPGWFVAAGHSASGPWRSPARPAPSFAPASPPRRARPLRRVRTAAAGVPVAPDDPRLGAAT